MHVYLYKLYFAWWLFNFFANLCHHRQDFSSSSWYLVSVTVIPWYVIWVLNFHLCHSCLVLFMSFFSRKFVTEIWNLKTHFWMEAPHHALKYVTLVTPRLMFLGSSNSSSMMKFLRCFLLIFSSVIAVCSTALTTQINSWNTSIYCPRSPVTQGIRWQGTWCFIFFTKHSWKDTLSLCCLIFMGHHLVFLSSNQKIYLGIY